MNDGCLPARPPFRFPAATGRRARSHTKTTTTTTTIVCWLVPPGFFPADHGGTTTTTIRTTRTITTRRYIVPAWFRNCLFFLKRGTPFRSASRWPGPCSCVRAKTEICMAGGWWHMLGKRRAVVNRNHRTGPAGQPAIQPAWEDRTRPHPCQNVLVLFLLRNEDKRHPD